MPIPVSPEHQDAELMFFDAVNERSHALEYLRKESSDIFNRLHSIAEDATFVEHIYQKYSTIPLLANLRCGAWYSDPSIAANTPAYFKSTDGHFSNWSFNLRRANLHLLPQIVDKHGVILVDSTRAGKRIPDALSKTVPIWCAVINRAVARRFPGALISDWDNALYTPPGAVSSQEHARIEDQLDNWVEALVQSSFTLPKLPYPLRPLWITPSTTTFPSLPRGFLPIICISASKQIEYGTERRSVGFSYIQGSGDDHELWSMGLTPDLFWKHKRDILEASRAELPRLILSLVSGRHIRNDRSPPSPITRVGGRLLICAISDLLPQDFVWTCELTNTAFLLLTSRSTEAGDISSASSGITILQVQVTEGKKGQIHFLAEVLPRSMDYIGHQLRCGKHVCVACSSGQDISVGVVLSALQQFFDDEGRYVTTELDTPPDKKSIRNRLEWIISSRPPANPSRTTLKRVNEFFLSSSFRNMSLKPDYEQ